MSRAELEYLRDHLKVNTDADAAPPETLRAGMEEACAGLQPPPDARIEKTSADGINAEWIEHKSRSADRWILYLHGGGYVIGSINTHRNLAYDLARETDAKALVVDYALAPENPYPAAVEDAVKAYTWLLGQGADPARTAIAGDSAGGGLTIATLLALRDRDLPSPAAGFTISPWADLVCESDAMTTKADEDPMVTQRALKAYAAHYLRDTDPKEPLASPVYADLTGLPPLLIHVGTAEVLLDDSIRLAARARACGVDVTLEEWPDMIHVWHAFAPLLGEGREAIARAGTYLAQRL